MSRLVATNIASVSDGLFARIINGFYHTYENDDNVDLDENDGWLDHGIEGPEKRRELITRSKTRHLHKTSYQIVSEPWRLFREFENDIKHMLDVGEPGDIKPLQIHLTQKDTTVPTKQHTAPLEKRLFKICYANELFRPEFIKLTILPDWVPTPIIVSKCPLAILRFGMNYRRMNKVTDSCSWPMSSIESDLADKCEVRFLVILDFCRGFLQAACIRAASCCTHS